MNEGLIEAICRLAGAATQPAVAGNEEKMVQDE